MIGRKVQALAQDSVGFIWIGTTEGISRFDGEYFKAYPFILDSLEKLPFVTKIFAYKPNEIWIGTRNLGLLVLNPNTGSYKQYWVDNQTQRGLQIQWIQAIDTDNEGKIWIGDFQRNLYYYDHSVDSFISVNITRPINISEPFPNPYITRIIPDKTNPATLWITSRDGLIQYHKNTHEYKYFYPPNQFKGVFFYLNKHINDALMLDNGHLVMGFWGGGLWIFDTKTYQWKNYLIDKKSERSGATNVVYSLSKIDNNSILIAAGDSSIGIFDINKEKFNFYTFDYDPRQGNQNFLGNAALVDRKGNLWVGGADGVVVAYTHWNLFETISLPPQKKPNSLFRVAQLIALHNGNFLAGSFFGDGIFLLNPQKSVIKKFSFQIPKSEPIGVKFLHQIKETDTVFVILDNDVYLLNIKTGAKYRIPTEKYYQERTEHAKFYGAVFNDILYVILPNYKVLAVHPNGKHSIIHEPDEEGIKKPHPNRVIPFGDELIFGSRYGPFSYNPKTQSVKLYQTFANHDTIGSVGRLTSDQNGNFFWIEARTKLIKHAYFDNQKWHLKHIWPLYTITEKEQLLGMQATSDSTLWLYNGYEIILFNPKTSGRLALSEADGLASISSYASFTNYPNVGLVIETTKGFLKFDPKKANLLDEIPSLYIKNVQINGMQIPVHLLPSKLHFTQNNIQIGLGILAFVARNRYQVAYRLQKNQSYSSTSSISQLINFSNLSPGNYELSFVLYDRNQILDVPLPKWNFEIIPPYYQRAWFIFGISCLIFSIVALFYKFKLNQIKREAHLKSDFQQQLLTLEMHALRAQMNPHFMFNSLNAIKMLMVETKTHDAIKYLTRFARLLRLILQNSKENLISLEQELEALQLYIQMESLRFNQNFDLEINVHEDLDKESILIPPMLVQPYVENAIWHGLHQSKTNGKLTINFEIIDNYVNIEIQDNGIGRKASAEIQSKTALRHKSFGTQITSSRIENLNKLYNINLSHSIIDLYNEYGEAKGTLVNIKLPLHLTHKKK